MTTGMFMILVVIAVLLRQRGPGHLHALSRDLRQLRARRAAQPLRQLRREARQERARPRGAAVSGHPFAKLTEADCWTTEELQRDFDVLGFSMGFVVVVRKRDGQRGSLEFTHSPRVYFNFEAA